MKKIECFFAFIGGICLIITTLWVILYNSCFDISLFKTSLDMGETTRILKMSENDIERSVEQMLLVSKGESRENIKVIVDGRRTDFLNQKELAHLVDISGLVKKFNHLSFVLGMIFATITALLLIRKSYKSFAVGMLSAEILTAVLMIVLLIAVSVNTLPMVYAFHELFFDNDLWMMDPAVDKIVWFFPMKLYVRATVRIAILFLGIMAGMTWISVFILKKEKKALN